MSVGQVCYTFCADYDLTFGWGRFPTCNGYPRTVVGCNVSV